MFEIVLQDRLGGRVDWDARPVRPKFSIPAEFIVSPTIPSALPKHKIGALVALNLLAERRGHAALLANYNLRYVRSIS